jgi:L-asparaginase
LSSCSSRHGCSAACCAGAADARALSITTYDTGSGYSRALRANETRQLGEHKGLHVIRIFVTGGTFDKTYDEIRGMLAFGDTHLPEMLRLGRSRVEVTVRTLMMVDSLDMTDADRELVVCNCVQCEEARIVITHGTDTMVETARAVAAGVSGKTVVLTGAMIPYAFGSSDGLFNLGSALSFVQVLPPGVYIAMNGQHFEWNKVRKNRETGVFETMS